MNGGGNVADVIYVEKYRIMVKNLAGNSTLPHEVCLAGNSALPHEVDTRASLHCVILCGHRSVNRELEKNLAGSSTLPHEVDTRFASLHCVRMSPRLNGGGSVADVIYIEK